MQISYTAFPHLEVLTLPRYIVSRDKASAVILFEDLKWSVASTNMKYFQNVVTQPKLKFHSEKTTLSSKCPEDMASSIQDGQQFLHSISVFPENRDE